MRPGESHAHYVPPPYKITAGLAARPAAGRQLAPHLPEQARDGSCSNFMPLSFLQLKGSKTGWIGFLWIGSVKFALF